MRDAIFWPPVPGVSVVVRLEGKSSEIRATHSPPFDQRGDQAQAWSKGLAGGLAHLSNHRVSGNSPVCVVESVQLGKRVQRPGAGREELWASMVMLAC